MRVRESFASRIRSPLAVSWLIIIVVGTVEAFVVAFSILPKERDSRRNSAVWLRYAHWLVAGLTFQLAADIIETSIAPTWDDIGRLTAIAVIRTFLNFFLERDLSEVRARKTEVSVAKDS